MTEGVAQTIGEGGSINSFTQLWTVSTTVLTCKSRYLHWWYSGTLVWEVTYHFDRILSLFYGNKPKSDTVNLGKKKKIVAGDIVGPGVELTTYNELSKCVAELPSKYLHLHS